MRPAAPQAHARLRISGERSYGKGRDEWSPLTVVFGAVVEKLRHIRP